MAVPLSAAVGPTRLAGDSRTTDGGVVPGFVREFVVFGDPGWRDRPLPDPYWMA